jgi:hypothetical protein
LYTGQTILHMAIGNDDTKFVRFLLEEGADIRAKAVGDIFMPSARRRGHSSFFAQIDDRVGVPNPDSAFEQPDLYFGQLPLSFAACFGHVKVCHELKLAFFDNLSCFSKGNNSQSARVQELQAEDKEHQSEDKPAWCKFINAQDDLGNTALHIAVMHKQTAIINWLMENGAKKSMRITNNLGLTPFTLSVWLGYVDMYSYIASRFLTQVQWNYGSCQLKLIDLEQIDSFVVEKDEDENADEPPCKQQDFRSAFEIIITRRIRPFVKETIFNNLLDTKWAAFGCWIYSIYVVFNYLVVLILYFFATFTRIQDLKRIHSYLALNPEEDPSVYLLVGNAAFQEVSGRLFLIIGSVGAIQLSYIAWLLFHPTSRLKGQRGDGQITFEELRMYLFENLASACCLATIALVEGIIVLRWYGHYEMVSLLVRYPQHAFACLHAIPAYIYAA